MSLLGKLPNIDFAAIHAIHSDAMHECCKHLGSKLFALGPGAMLSPATATRVLEEITELPGAASVGAVCLSLGVIACTKRDCLNIEALAQAIRERWRQEFFEGLADHQPSAAETPEKRARLA
mgnify:CR=1 FL=1